MHFCDFADEILLKPLLKQKYSYQYSNLFLPRRDVKRVREDFTAFSVSLPLLTFPLFLQAEEAVVHFFLFPM